MDKNNEYAYSFHQVEPGIEIRVFLPFKIHYQGFFWETLATGLTTFSFADHYRNHQLKIDQLLAQHAPIAGINDEKLALLDSPYSDIMKGFSISTVDGSFRFSETNSVGKNLPRFSEERTLEICILFIPDYSRLLAELNQVFPEAQLTVDTIIEFVDLFLKTCHSCQLNQERRLARMNFYLDDPGHLRLLGFHNREQATLLLDKTTLWVDAVYLFIAGYMIFSYTEALQELYKADTIKHLEEEIWIKSHWGIGVNRTILYDKNP